MKKRSRLLLAGVVLAAALSIGALAADEPVKGGIYNISGTGATLTPQTESQGTITPTTDGDKTGYYANAVRMGVEATGLESGKQYLLPPRTTSPTSTRPRRVRMEASASTPIPVLSRAAPTASISWAAAARSVLAPPPPSRWIRSTSLATL